MSHRMGKMIPIRNMIQWPLRIVKNAESQDQDEVNGADTDEVHAVALL